MVDAKLFHPMRGDAFVGNKILFKDGEILTLAMEGMQWAVRDVSGMTIACCDGAYDLCSWIVQREPCKAN